MQTAPMPPNAQILPIDPDDDDRLIGRVLTRREVLALMGSASVAAIAAACAPSVGSSAAATASAGGTVSATALPAASAVAVASSLPSCVVVPQVTEGPYYVNENLERSDIRIDTADGAAVPGATLRLDWVVSQVAGSACIPLEGVLVDVWHCNADGVYSDVSDRSFNTVGHNFLRGYQHTDANGAATITTIVPGWYSGRTVHIHFKIRTDPSASNGFEFTSQLFFEDSFNDKVFSQGAYAAHGSPDVRNASDGIYEQTQGMTLLHPTRSGDGYAATFEIALQTA